MLCEIAKKIDEGQLERIKALEDELGMTIVAFSCRSLDAKREERLQKIIEELGPQLQAEPAKPDDEAGWKYDPFRYAPTSLPYLVDKECREEHMEEHVHRQIGSIAKSAIGADAAL